MTTQTKNTGSFITGLPLIAVTAALMLCACGAGDQATSEVAGQAGTEPTGPAPADAAPAAMAQPAADENAKPEGAEYVAYSPQEQFYDYKSEDGKVYRFGWLGRRDGELQLMQPAKDGVSVVYSCKEPCATLTVYDVWVYNPPNITKTQQIPADPKSPVMAGMRDAAAGHLTQFVELEPGGKAQIWVSAEEGPLTIMLDK